MTTDVSALRVDDQAFLVSSTIERCPKVMMIRELTKNAIEAAAEAEPNDRRVEFSATRVHGVPKLTIWNTGLGMDDDELSRMTNLAASIGKQKGLDKNFGMGAKVASLPSNRHGIRYRSCKAGSVHEVILCERDGVYGRLKRRNTNGEELGDVVDVTEQVRAEGDRLLTSDWTEVVLLGNRPDQDTVSDPYDGDPKQPKFWLATYLYHRFYRLPPGVEIRLDEGTHARGPGSRKFETMPARETKAAFTRAETVSLSNGIKLHYIYDEAFKDTSHNKSISGAIASAVSTAAVVFRDEMYAVLTGRAWTIEAPTFGIPFGAKHISVHIELPDDARLRPEGYRQFLRYVDGEQDQVEAADFAVQVLENRPAWLIDLIHSLAPNTGDSNEEIRKRLQELLNKLRVKAQSPRVVADGDITVGAGPGGGMAPVRSSGQSEGRDRRQNSADLTVMQSGAQLARMAQNLERAPSLIPLDDEEEIEAKNLRGRAARYYAKTGELFINMRYPAVDLMREQLEQEYAHAGDVDIMKRLAVSHSRNSMIQRAGLAVVFALAKRLNKEWDEEAMGKALEPESLSLAADNFYEAMQDARRAIGKALKIRRSEYETEAETAVA
ncbi:sensor histidine kinase [Bradyrhizobium sp. OK095]|uniref:sensor histidine kinase n=1 Tax=Bradyrhizobium sp. OK095 TaxID=1882760 RepID=UPI0008B0EBA4|nr:sensor histidine kinase [Bradyrhizobium sp. OK095]SEN82109.1 hypothetical protein SAMN05443254_1128 [Bradyrhizobium sp. OK095]